MKNYSKKMIKGWKVLLLKKDEKSQIRAGKEILIHIKNIEKPGAIEIMRALIDDDFVDLICHCMETWNFKLVREMYTILLYLFETKRFFEYSRVVLVLDALLRNIQNFYKMKPESTIFSVHLLTQLIAKTKIHKMKDLYKPEVLLKVIERLTKQQYFAEMEKNIFNLTYVLLCDTLVDIPKNLDLEVLKRLSFKACITLYQEIETSETNARKMSNAKLMTKIMIKILRNFTIDGNKNNRIIEHIRCSCNSIAAFPRMDNCDTRIALGICEYFLAIADSFGEQMQQWLVKFITENGFLMFFLRHFEMCGASIKVKESFIQLLQMCIEVLSDDSSQKIDKIGNIIYEGLKNIPPKSTCALELEKPNFTPTQVAIVTILYYHFSKCNRLPEITSSTLNKNELMRESNLLKVFSSITTPDSSVLKMLIFLYAVSSMNSKIAVDERVKQRGYKKIIKIINTSENLEDLYSHHQIFIQWTISTDNLSKDFKACAITQWLSRKDGDTRLVDNILEKNPNALSLLLSMLCLCQKEIVSSLLKTLRNYQAKLANKNDNRLNKKVWNSLIKVFDFYLGNKDKAMNLAAYVNIAATGLPAVRQPYKMMQIAGKLLKIIETQIHDLNCLLTLASFSLIKVLISYFITEGELRGVLIFFKTKVLINLLKITMFHEDELLADASEKLITFISTTQCQMNFESEECLTIAMDSMLNETKVSQARTLNCVKIYGACIGTRSLKKPFIAMEIVPNQNKQMCYKLYLTFLTISSMIINNDCELYWMCMEKLLQEIDIGDRGGATVAGHTVHIATVSTVSRLLPLLLTQQNSAPAIPITNPLHKFIKEWLRRFQAVALHWEREAQVYIRLSDFNGKSLMNIV